MVAITVVAVMIIVAAGTFDWHSVAPFTLRRMPEFETTIMVTTVIGTVVTHNLAYGVVADVIIAMILFANQIAHFTTVMRLDASDEGDERVRRRRGTILRLIE